MILNGKLLSEKLLLDLSEKIKALKHSPTLAVLLVGDDYASSIYVKNKFLSCEKVGIKSLDFRLDKNTSETKILEIISELNQNDDVDGILVQLPLPPHIDKNSVINAIDPRKDVDGFTPHNLGLLLSNQTPHFYACTPLGIMLLLEHYGITLKGKNVCIIGESIIVGRPLAAMLLNEGASVDITHIHTKDLRFHTKNAEIIISATGVLHLLSLEDISPNAIVIDVGISKKLDDGSKISGDFLPKFKNQNTAAGKKNHNTAEFDFSYSPVPGGVGPMTIYSLMQNTYEARLKKEKNENKA